MAKGDVLGEFEHLVLLAVLRLRDDSYGMRSGARLPIAPAGTSRSAPYMRRSTGFRRRDCSKRRSATRLRSGPVEMFDGEESYTLARTESGHTRMSIDSRYHQWFAALMEPLVTPAADKKMQRDLAHLKALVEAKAEVR